MVSLQFCDELPCRYTAPPRRIALLLIKVQLLTIPKEPIHIIAPPFLVALPKEKSEFTIVVEFPET